MKTKNIDSGEIIIGGITLSMMIGAGFMIYKLYKLYDSKNTNELTLTKPGNPDNTLYLNNVNPVAMGVRG